MSAQVLASPLQLDRYFLKRLYFQLYEGFDRMRVPNAEITVPSLQIDVVAAEQNPENELQWRFEVNLELLDPQEGTKCPYKVESTLVGYFTVSSEYPREKAERLAKTNGPAVLYSSARETLGAVTGRSGYPPLLIPSVMFIQPERAVAAPQQVAEAEEAAPLQLASSEEATSVEDKQPVKEVAKKAAKKGSKRKGKQ